MKGNTTRRFLCHCVRVFDPPERPPRAMERPLFIAALSFFTLPVLGVAQSIVYPDLQVLTPQSEISIGTNASTGAREFRFSHITWNAGAGPLEIRPNYNSTTGFA